MGWTGLVLLATLAGTALLCAKYHLSAHPLEAEFERYIQKWEKKYSAVEKAKRFPIFADNYVFVMAENAKGHRYKLDVNEFADMTADEFGVSHFGLKKPEKMWGDATYLGEHKFSGATPPASVDWSQKGAVTPIKNQGQCGSCWSFSTTGSLEGAHQIATGKLVSFSEQQFVDCDKVDHGCQGGLMDNAFKYAEQNGLCTEESYPYKGKAGTCQATTCTTGLAKGGVTGYKDVTSQNTQAMEEAVAQQPVSIAIEADQRIFQLYKSGVLNGTCGTKLDHGVLAVGYGTLNGADYWKVKNSWGATWGNQGFILLAKGKDAAGECGIKMQPSYPVVSGKPGPSPGPSPPPAPPSPPAPPTPPTPSSPHYEKPPCQAGETEASVQNANGEVCAPKCDSTGGCPTDVPPGTTDKPKCLLQDQSGNKYCALTCLLGGCPTGAKCAHIGGIMGICVYPQGDRKEPATVLHKIDSEETLKIDLTIAV